MAAFTLASLGVSTTLEYTSPCNAKVRLSCHGNATGSTGEIYLNEVTIGRWYAAVSNLGGFHHETYFYIGKGQSFKIETGSASYCIVSIYEE